jgi:hypothetical protein
MRICFALIFVVAVVLIMPAQSADDWTFVGTGKYAVSAGDCKHLAKGRPFSKALAKQLESEALTREGITSPRETHCRFRNSTREASGTKWTVKAKCEELGEASPDLENVVVTKNADGSLDVVAEETFGPDALKFKLCR